MKATEKPVKNFLASYMMDKICPTILFYDILLKLPTHSNPARKGGLLMNLDNFLLNVLAGIVSAAAWYKIQKWLER